MRILVTGSTGFIGSALCAALCAQGHNVVAFHRATSPLRMLENLPVEHAIGDLTQPETVQEAVKDVEVIYHAAAHLGSQMGRGYAVTVEGTRTVLAAARVAGVRQVVYTSSMSALGVPEEQRRADIQPTLLNENHAWNFLPQRWPYGYAKYLAELEVQKAVAQGLNVVIVNPTMVYGPGDVYRQTSSIIVQVARQRIPAVVDGGLNVVHLEDVVRGHLLAAERGRSGERYILGGENMTHHKFVQKIAAVAGVPAPTLILPGGLIRSLAGPVNLLQNFISLPVSAGQFHLAGYYFYCDTHKAQVELGHRPTHSVEDAIRDAYHWFQQAGALPV